MTETTYTAKVVKILRRAGAFVWKTHGGGMSAAGMPDLYVAHPRIHGWVEVKYGRGRLTALQAHRIDELRARGVTALVLYGPEGMVDGVGGDALLGLLDPTATP